MPGIMPSFNAKLIESYLEQPGQLPGELRAEAERLGGSLQLYGLADLDPSQRLASQWVLLTERLLLTEQEGRWTSIPREQIDRVESLPGMSVNRMRLLGADKTQAPLLELHFSRRQQRCLENIRILLEAKRSSDALPDADQLYAESVAEPVRNAQAAVRGSELAVIWRLLGYLKPYRADVWIGGLAAILLTLLALVPPFLSGKLIDGLQQGADLESLFQLVGLMAAAVVLRTFFLWVRLRRMAMMGERVAHDIRQHVYGHLQTLSLRFFTRKQTGSIIARCSSDTDRLWDFIAFGVIEVALAVLMLLGLGGVLLVLDWRLGLVLTLPVPVILFAFYRHSTGMQTTFLKAWRKWSDLTSVLSGTIPGMRVVKAFHQEEREVRRFGRENDACLETFTRIHKVWTNFWPLLSFGFQIITLTMYVFALPQLTGGTEPALSIGIFVTFLLYAGMFMQPLETIGQMTRMMNRAVSSAHRIFEILDTEPQIQDTQDAVVLSPLQGAIVFDQVGFTYDGVRPVLKEISFSVNPGEVIGLVGPSGAGKSTIIQLLARFYDPVLGRILVDGVDLRQVDLGAYRRQVGMVLQDPYLFHGSLMDNIAYGMENPDPGAVIEAARAAHAHDFICGFEQGYETMVGERGQTLSGGERQRISIARAILHNPKILILDEATSNVDTETERKIQDALDRLVEGRTVIAIAHRLSTLRRASRLVVLKDGRIVESGTHDELLQMESGVFRKLVDLQQELHQRFAI